MINRLENQRGNVLVFVAVSLTLFFMFLALSVDIGWIMLTKSELQSAADSAALAGAAQLAEGNLDLARDFSQDFSSYNTAAKESIAVDRNNENDVDGGIVVGYLENPLDLEEPLQTEGVSRYNSVQVETLRSAEINGPLQTFLGFFTGLEEVSIRTQATATFDDRVIGFDAPEGGNAMILPFAMYYQIWRACNDPDYTPGPGDCPKGGCTDTYTYSGGQVKSGADGYPEMKLYPNKAGTCCLPGAPGNFGTVDIGPGNNSTADLKRQIVEGVRPDELAMVGNLVLTDEDGDGVPTLWVEADTGVSDSVKSSFEQIIGKARCIPLFRNLTGNGNNARYEICGFAGIRIMDLKMTGKLEDRYVLVQKAVVTGSGAVFHADAPHSNSIFNLSLTR